MKLNILGAIVILFLALSCSESDDSNDPQLELNGNYTGIFERNGNTSIVQLNLENGNFSGESETDRFPAICNGNYSISDTAIAFENQCVFTADFDWTLILGENWSYSLTDEVLTLTKSNGDTYILNKQ
jgi:hypothetical protein